MKCIMGTWVTDDTNNNTNITGKEYEHVDRRLMAISWQRKPCMTSTFILATINIYG